MSLQMTSKSAKTPGLSLSGKQSNNRISLDHLSIEIHLWSLRSPHLYINCFNSDNDVKTILWKVQLKTWEEIRPRKRMVSFYRSGSPSVHFPDAMIICKFTHTIIAHKCPAIKKCPKKKKKVHQRGNWLCFSVKCMYWIKAIV